jgi:hypothetical protein
VARPTDSSKPFLCPFRHNNTLQHYRLLSVTTNVTGTNFWINIAYAPVMYG